MLRYQHQFVDKILSHTLKYNHVLCCITNEIHPQYSPEWGWYWAKYIKKKASEADKRIEVSETLWQTNLRSEQHKASLDHSEIYSYFECSQNSANPGAENGQNMQYIYSYLTRHPRPVKKSLESDYPRPEAVAFPPDSWLRQRDFNKSSGRAKEL